MYPPPPNIPHLEFVFISLFYFIMYNENGNFANVFYIFETSTLITYQYFCIFLKYFKIYRMSIKILLLKLIRNIKSNGLCKSSLQNRLHQISTSCHVISSIFRNYTTIVLVNQSATALLVFLRNDVTNHIQSEKYTSAQHNTTKEENRHINMT